MKKIIELMDSPVPFDDNIESESYIATFIIEGIEYTFNALLINNFVTGAEWIIDFRAHESTDDILGSTDITGTGNEFIVFATIAAIMKEFLAHYDPEKFYFTAKEKSRVRLYDIFAQRIAKEWNYKIELDRGLKSTSYHFTRR